MATEQQATTTEAAATKLAQASRLVAEALETLDASVTECKRCGHAVPRNRTHAKLKESLGETPRKLVEAARRMRNDAPNGSGNGETK